MAEQTILKSKSEWTTVWTNPDPSQAFANDQTVSIDLTPYSELCFVLKSTITGAARYYEILPIPAPSAIINCISERIWLRYAVECTTSGINFGYGAVVNNYGARTDSTSNAIPIMVLAR